MSYSVFISYPGGARSHKLLTTSRADVESHLDGILRETEILELAETVNIRYNNREILCIPATMSPNDIKKAIQWPLRGAPNKVEKPVAATIYMPQEVREWLAKKGNGKVSRGLRQLIEESNVPELENAWVR